MQNTELIRLISDTCMSIPYAKNSYIELTKLQLLSFRTNFSNNFRQLLKQVLCLWRKQMFVYIDEDFALN